MAEPTGNGSKPVAAIVRATQVLDALAARLEAVTLQEITTSTGLNKATVHRILTTLQGVGWISHLEGGRYALAPHVLVLARSAQAQIDVRALARPHLESLAAEFGDTAFLFVPTARESICLDLVTGDSPITVNTVGLGSVLPCYAGGAPVLMAAYLPRLREATLASDRPAFTPRTIVDADELRARWDAVAEAGYIVAEQDLAADTAVVSAPIFGPDGLVGTVSLGGLAAHFAPPRRERIVERVIAAADAVSRLLGVSDPQKRRTSRGGN